MSYVNRVYALIGNSWWILILIYARDFDSEPIFLLYLIELLQILCFLQKKTVHRLHKLLGEFQDNSNIFSTVLTGKDILE